MALCLVLVAAGATRLVSYTIIEADKVPQAVQYAPNRDDKHFYATGAERDKAERSQAEQQAGGADSTDGQAGEADQPTVIGKQYPDLHYSWTPAQAYAYAFQLKADVKGRAHTFNGSCQFYSGPTWEQLVSRALPASPEAPSKQSAEGPEIADRLVKDIAGDEAVLAQKFAEEPVWDSVGSAFAITADGWFVTCAHVVEDADQVQVRIDGEDHAAQVKVIDFKHDLALLKTGAKGLEPLSVAPAETIQLGDEVRVVGFPLAELLKSRLNVTRGTISTQPTGEEGDALQIDAAVNPGNSGGPVVNVRGQLVGVASSKVVHEAVSGVSFATPSEQVVRLAQKHKVAIDLGPPQAPPGGTSALKQATRAVGLVRIKLSPEKSRDGSKLRYSANLSSTAAPSQGIGWYEGRRDHLSSRSPDAFGRMDDAPDGLRLPFLMLHPAELVIEQLDTRGRDSWVTDQRFDVDMASLQPRRSSYRSTHILMPPPGSLVYSTNGRGFPSLTATGERHDENAPFTLSLRALHKVIERKENKITVAKRVEIRATLPEGKPVFEMTGTGGYVFDASVNNVEETVLKLKCEWLRSKNQASFPVDFYAKRVAKDAKIVQYSLNNIKKRIRAEEAESKKLHTQANRTSQAALSDCVEKLTSKKTSEFEIGKTLSELSRFPVDDTHQEEVTRALRRHAASDDFFSCSRACKLLAKWGGKSQSSFLIDRLRRAPDSLKGDIVDALGECGDAAAAKPILEYFEDSNGLGGRMSASRALIKLGPGVEDLVTPLLKQIDSDTRKLACDVLRKVGTEKSLPAVEELIASTRSWDRRDAERVKRAIEERRDRGEQPKEASGKAERVASKAPPVDSASEAEQVIASLAAGKNAGQFLARLRVLSKSPMIDRVRESAVEAITPHLVAGANSSVTLEAVRAIGVWGDERHSAALVKLLALAKTDEARESLFVALGRVGDEKAGEAIRPYLSDSTLGFRAATALRRIPPAMQQEFIERLEDADVFQRAIAAEVLGRAGDADAKQALEKRVQEERLGSLAYERCLVAIARIELRLKKVKGPRSSRS